MLAEGKGLETKGHVVHDSFYMELSEMVNSLRHKVVQWMSKNKGSKGVGDRERMLVGIEGFFRVIKLFQK